MGAEGDEQFPEELESVAAMLRSHRARPEPLDLDQLKQRALARHSRRERRTYMRSRIITVLTAIGLIAGGGGAFALANSSSTAGGSAASKAQYCPPKDRDDPGCKKHHHHHHCKPGSDRDDQGNCCDENGDCEGEHHHCDENGNCEDEHHHPDNDSSDRDAESAGGGAAATAGFVGGAAGPGTEVVSARDVAPYGFILVDGAGRTLYAFTADNASRVSCTGACATTVPPLVLPPGDQLAALGRANSSLEGTDPDPSGGTVVTYNGWPLYTYSGDSGPGVANGEGRNGSWYVMSPSGQMIKR
jgi:predicted lipoprotein with Yx(FWY)xxD motif